MNAPEEIWRTILRHATLVPDVYAGSDAALDDADELCQALRTSMGTKLALCLVSRAFYSLGREFLYEAITVRHFRRIHLLVEALRRGEIDSPSNGWWCRRLDVMVSCGVDDWRNGVDTLWGLLPSCPRLLQLHIAVQNVTLPLGPGMYISPMVPVGLARTIATSFGTTLRGLSVAGQLQIDYQHVHALLSSMPALERCRITRVVGERPSTKASALTPSHTSSTSIDDAHVHDIQLARPWRSGREHFLPRLHTLDVQPFLPELLQWHLPSLSSVTVSRTALTSLPLGLSSLEKALAGYASSIRHLDFYGEELDAWSVVQKLPNVASLTYDARYAYEVAMPPCPPCPSIRTITLRRYQYFPNSIRTVLDNLLVYLSAGMLPALRLIRVRGERVGDERVFERSEHFQLQGVMLDIGRPSP